MLNVDFSTADLGNDPVDPGDVFPVNLEDVRRAHRVVMDHLKPTPTVNHPLLCQRLGCKAFVKLENTHNIGSFKIRGGLNLLANALLKDPQKYIKMLRGEEGSHGKKGGRGGVRRQQQHGQGQQQRKRKRPLR